MKGWIIDWNTHLKLTLILLCLFSDDPLAFCKDWWHSLKPLNRLWVELHVQRWEVDKAHQENQLWVGVHQPLFQQRHLCGPHLLHEGLGEIMDSAALDEKSCNVMGSFSVCRHFVLTKQSFLNQGFNIQWGLRYFCCCLVLGFCLKERSLFVFMIYLWSCG